MLDQVGVGGVERPLVAVVWPRCAVGGVAAAAVLFVLLLQPDRSLRFLLDFVSEI